jgi:hypothetical protein
MWLEICVAGIFVASAYGLYRWRSQIVSGVALHRFHQGHLNLGGFVSHQLHVSLTLYGENFNPLPRNTTSLLFGK